MTFRGRVFRQLAGISLAAVLLGVVGSTIVARESMMRSAEQRLTAETALLADRLAAEGDSTRYGQLAQEWGEKLQLRVTVVDGSGRVVADSTMRQAGLALLDNHDDRPEIIEARESGLGVSWRRSHSTGLEYVYVARRVAGPGGAVLRLAMRSDAITLLGGVQAGAVVLAALAIALVLVGVSVWLARRLARSMERAGDTLQELARGIAPSHRQPPRDNDEERIGLALDRLQMLLDDRAEESRSTRWLLESIVEGMREGLLIVDADQRVLAANEALRRVLTAHIEPVGKLQGEVFRHPDVIQSIESSLARGEEVRKRVDDRPATGKIFDLQVTSVKREGDVATQAAVALLYDVSRLEQLESVRRTFVADVSHELRTPLTSIKAAVEMLIDDSELDRVRADRFLSMIERHAGRMEALIDDLSDLSKIETGAVSLDKREVELSLLVRKVLDDLAQRASEYGIALRDEVPVGLTLVADPRRLEQMLVNLVDNAIKFSRERGAVAVRAGKDGERTVIEVEDTGIGIPSDSLERVFNRFFRVDEARSRETGGTGLGLSIVKHLMQLHGGRVRVESELGSGSRFILEF